MKLKCKCLLSIVLCLSILSGCSNENRSNGTYVSFARKENLSDALRKSLFEQLKENDIEYIIDTEGSVYVSEKDINKAVSCCS
ncbi:Uncharacterised protein [Lysinibacillus sphaericus]|uniref:Lipoprotein n=1 Tax=Lysinibacillus sphaericus TaxID=1421 RepID=A0A2S0K2H4_LYSSH|nr:hypothetical protein T479_07865 [Lysinibacillus varians]AVK97509.1 hypothetical protein LS41612_15125 [Lysinibacillus sphaericus]GEC83333.1 hypothetical protein LSP03_30760 [Lysinibacillus sphaericus]SUV16582.1 Uncharacterised protein [Lysinibacillus sphaericus]